MLSKEEFVVLDHYLREGLPKAVLHHYLRERLPKAVIARKLGISCMTVHRHAATDKPFADFGEIGHRSRSKSATFSVKSATPG